MALAPLPVKAADPRMSLPGMGRDLGPRYHSPPQPRGVAQLAEHRSPKPGVAGSSPAAPASARQGWNLPRIPGAASRPNAPPLVEAKRFQVVVRGDEPDLGAPGHCLDHGLEEGSADALVTFESGDERELAIVGLAPIGHEADWAPV